VTLKATNDATLPAIAAAFGDRIDYV